MRKNPIYQFENETSVGIINVPNETIVLIENYHGEELKRVYKTGKDVGWSTASTIEDFILDPTLYIEILSADKNRHGYIAEAGLGVYVPDLEFTDFFDYTVGSDALISAPVNAMDGDTGTIKINQDATGGHTVTFASEYLFGNGAPDIAEAQGIHEVMLFEYSVVGTQVFMEYVTSLNTGATSKYDTEITWDTMSGDAAVISDVDVEYSNDGGLSFSPLLGGSEQVLGVGVGPYELRADGASFLAFGLSSTARAQAAHFNGEMTVVSVGLTSGDSMFYGMSNLQKINFANFDTSNISNMKNMLRSWFAMPNTPDLTNFNTSNVTTMENMMRDMRMISDPPNLSNFDMSSVVNLDNMMRDWREIKTLLDLSSFDISSATTASGWLQGFYLLPVPPDLSGLNTSNLTNMAYMMYGWKSIISPPDLSNFDTANTMYIGFFMTDWESVLTPPNLSSFDTSKVRDIKYFTFGWLSLTNIGLIGMENFNLTSLLAYAAPIPPSTVHNSGYRIGFNTDFTVATYDKILENYGSRASSMTSGVRLDFDGNHYTAGGAGEAGRNLLIAAGVIINDGGAV